MIYACFDLGNVLVHADFSQFHRALSKSLNITLAEADYFMNRTQKLHDLGYTRMADELRDHFKIRSSVIIEELIESWNKVISPAEFILNKVADMTNIHKLRIAFLSNIGLEHSAIMNKMLDNYFDMNQHIKFFSCQVGARKPNIIYYQSFLQLYPKWKNSPYIDDLQENLETSRQFDFRTYRFSLEETMAPGDRQSIDQKWKKIEKFILETNL